MYICPCHSLTSSQLTLPPPHVLTSMLYVCIFIPFLPLGSSEPLFFFRFHIYVLAYSICFSLSDLFHSLWQSLGPSTSLQITQFCFFLWLSNIPLYICAISSLSIHLSMDTQTRMREREWIYVQMSMIWKDFLILYRNLRTWHFLYIIYNYSS